MTSRLPPALARRLDRIAWRAHLFHRYAHHPLCAEYRDELIALGRRSRICRGCTYAIAGALAGIAVGALFPAALWLYAAVGLTELALQGPGRTRTHSKLHTRLLTSSGTLAAVAAAVVLRTPLALAAGAACLVAGLVALFAYRRRGPSRAPCDACPERTRQPECRGYRPIMQRERAFQRLANRLIVRSQPGT